MIPTVTVLEMSYIRKKGTCTATDSIRTDVLITTVVAGTHKVKPQSLNLHVSECNETSPILSSKRMLCYAKHRTVRPTV